MSNRRALIVDDNVASATTLVWMAEAEGYEAVMCHDGPSAIALCETFKPDVIFLDVGMRGMNGLEVCMTLRNDPRFQTIPIVAQTGWGDAKMREMTRNAGFTEHLVKPVPPDRFCEILRETRIAA